MYDRCTGYLSLSTCPHSLKTQNSSRFTLPSSPVGHPVQLGALLALLGVPRAVVIRWHQGWDIRSGSTPVRGTSVRTGTTPDSSLCLCACSESPTGLAGTCVRQHKRRRARSSSCLCLGEHSLTSPFRWLGPVTGPARTQHGGGGDCPGECIMRGVPGDRLPGR